MQRVGAIKLPFSKRKDNIAEGITEYEVEAEGKTINIGTIMNICTFAVENT